MRKAAFIFMLVIVCILGIFLIYQLVNNTKTIDDMSGYSRISVSNDDKKELMLLDVILRNKMTKYENEIYGQYEVDQIVEKEYFETFWGQKVGADIIRKDGNDGYIYASVIMHDSALGQYEILKNTRSNMCVFSYISLESNEEKYRYYLEDGKIEFYQDLQTGEYKRIANKTDLLNDEKTKIENVCNYYLNFSTN